MKHYNKTQAAAFILRRIYLENYTTLTTEMLKPLVVKCIEADFDYMIQSDIIYPDGSRSEYYYNKENARRYILYMLADGRALTDEQFDDLYKLVDDYLDFNLSYLEKHGMRYPTDEMIIGQ